MTQYDELPVYKASYVLLIQIFRFTKNFVKDYKYTIGSVRKYVLYFCFFVKTGRQANTSIKVNLPCYDDGRYLKHPKANHLIVVVIW